MDKSGETWVFAYGTLQPGGRYHDAYCGGFAFEAIRATTRGRLYNFPQLGYPGAVEDRAYTIQGTLLRFRHPEAEILPRLDELEGFDAAREVRDNEYYRKRVEVFAKGKRAKPVTAWCYFMTSAKVRELGGVRIESGTWPIENS